MIMYSCFLILANEGRYEAYNNTDFVVFQEEEVNKFGIHILVYIFSGR